MTPLFEFSSKLFPSRDPRGRKNLPNHALCSGRIPPCVRVAVVRSFVRSVFVILPLSFVRPFILSCLFLLLGRTNMLPSYSFLQGPSQNMFPLLVLRCPNSLAYSRLASPNLQHHQHLIFVETEAFTSAVCCAD